LSISHLCLRSRQNRKEKRDAEVLGAMRRDPCAQGWTLGGGGEWMFAPHWSVFAEYNFMGFGGSNIQDIAAGVNYKF
jgi:opacity protein-like surface antigen